MLKSVESNFSRSHPLWSSIKAYLTHFTIVFSSTTSTRQHFQFSRDFSQWQKEKCLVSTLSILIVQSDEGNTRDVKSLTAESSKMLNTKPIPANQCQEWKISRVHCTFNRRSIAISTAGSIICSSSSTFNTNGANKKAKTFDSAGFVCMQKFPSFKPKTYSLPPPLPSTLRMLLASAVECSLTSVAVVMKWQHSSVGESNFICFRFGFGCGATNALRVYICASRRFRLKLSALMDQ